MTDLREITLGEVVFKNQLVIVQGLTTWSGDSRILDFHHVLIPPGSICKLHGHPLEKRKDRKFKYLTQFKKTLNIVNL